MDRADRVLLSIIYLPILPLLLFLLGWWGSLVFVQDSSVPIAAAVGLAVGLALDIVYWRRWMRNDYATRPLVMGAIYALYSVLMFGFFMGVPVFNVLLGASAGFYVARRALVSLQRGEAALASLRCTARFCVGVLALICAGAAYLAIADPYTAANLEGMFGLRWHITMPLLYGLIIIGGGLLLLVQYWLVMLTGTQTLAHSRKGGAAGSR